MRGLRRQFRPLIEPLEKRLFLSTVGFATGIYPTGRSPIWSATADFNGDAKPDVAVIDRRDRILTILLNRGDGTFATRCQVALNNPAAIATGDFDGSGTSDIAVLCASPSGRSRNIRIFFGNGDGTLSGPALYRMGPGNQMMTSADLNGDGRIDLITAGTNSVLVMLNQGGGTFAPPAAYGIGARRQPWYIVAADLNKDGAPDLLVASMRGFFKRGPSTGYLITLMGRLNSSGQATGTLGDPIIAAQAPQSMWITTGDFNGDGWIDAATVGYWRGNTDIWLGNGDGTFAPAPSLATNAWVAAAADYNGDGIADLAVPGENVFIGNGDGTFTSTQTNVLGIDLPSVSDLNGDAKPDLVGIGQGAIGVLTNHGEATPPTASSLTGTVFNDSNGNRRLDAGEQGQAGITAYLDLNHNRRMDAAEPSATSDASGQYQLTNVPAGRYVLRVAYPRGIRQTVPRQRFYRLDVGVGEFFGALDFGVRQPVSKTVVHRLERLRAS